MSRALFSDCKQYRYILIRDLHPSLHGKRALFIMLNPSTADEVKNDPTIRRCISFAEREGCHSLTVVNLFALRSTDPKVLKNHRDPIGPDNDGILDVLMHSHKNSLRVAAWGANPIAKERGNALIEKYGPLLCLGITKNGSPKHALYVKTDQPLVEIK